MIDRFVILTAPRSGSNMLVGLLEQHPRVRCFGELMRVTPAWFGAGTRQPRPESVLHVFRRLRDRFPDDAARFADPLGFIEAAYATQPGGASYGFKLHLHQKPALTHRLIDDPRYALILLRRENVLAQYSSEKIAERTGQGAARMGDRVERATVRFDADDFDRYLETWEGVWARLHERLASASRPSVSVSYLDLATGSGVGRVAKHLGLPEAHAIEPVTLRRNDPCILNRFSNRAAVEAALSRIGREAWATESRSTVPADDPQERGG